MEVKKVGDVEMKRDTGYCGASQSKMDLGMEALVKRMTGFLHM